MNDVRPRTANTPEVVRRIDPDPPIRRTETVTSTDGTKIGVHTLGAGEGVLVVGGALSTARDYLPLATVLAQSFTVHLMERRGRGISDPQGPDYKIASESEDLLAVQATTGGTRVFGHSYGGLVALETARHSEAFSLVAAYEPFVSIDGSIPLGWIPRYKSYLSNEDTRGAFVCLVQGSGFAPRPIMKMPSWCVRAILRIAIRGSKWEEIESVLHANLAENEQVMALDRPTPARYAAIKSHVLLLGGDKSPAFVTTRLLADLHRQITHSEVELLKGVGHDAPNEKAPELVGDRLARFLRSPT